MARSLPAILLAAAALSGACHGAPASSTSSPVSTATASPPCDPGAGHPSRRATCPDPRPLTGWLRERRGGQWVLEPFRSLTNDVAGHRYAESHGIGFPFANDVLDVSTGAPTEVTLPTHTICTGIVAVGHREPLADRVVDCAEFTSALRVRPVIPVALWHADGEIVQLSELYRP